MNVKERLTATALRLKHSNEEQMEGEKAVGLRGTF